MRPQLDACKSQVPLNLWIFQRGSQFILDAILDKHPEITEIANQGTDSNFSADGRKLKSRYNKPYTYYGQLSRSGSPHGVGRCIMDDNTIYEGLFMEGLLNGFGNSFHPDGSYYVGEFLKGKRAGTGYLD